MSRAMVVSNRAFRLQWLPLLVVLLVVAVAEAHQRSVSYSTWRLDGREARVRLRVAELDLTRVPPPLEGEGEVGAWLANRLVLLAGAEPCAIASPPEATRSEPGWITFAWAIRCRSEGALRVRSQLFADTSSRHLHFARVERGSQSGERVLSGREPEWALEGEKGESTQTGVTGYLRLGVEHILGGYDHLAFVLGLLLLASSLGGLVRVVTGFTLGHSLTLGLAATGVAAPAIEPIEALIGLSIALVAVENLWLLGDRSPFVPAGLVALLAGLAVLAHAGAGGVPSLTLLGFAVFIPFDFALLARSARPEAIRGGVAFVFGLLHGFGFATVLVEAGLPAARLLPALFAFNLGVEAGQLAVVAVLWTALARTTTAVRTRLVEVGSASVLALGTFWFVVRTFA